MARLMGAEGQVKIGGTAWNIVREWRVRREAITVDATGAGDAVEFNQALRTRHVFSADVISDATAPYKPGIDIVGTTVTWVALIDDAHTNGLATSSGIVSSAEWTNPYNDVATIAIEVLCDGTAMTVDTSPAT